MNTDKEFLSVKEFAAAAGVTTQYIYKVLGTKLKPYKKKIDKKTYISSSAIVLIKDATNETNLESNKDNRTEASEIDTLREPQTAKNTTLQPTLQPMQPTNATNKDGEIEALKQLIEELKQDKEDLKKDKEDLKQEAIKWQQLLLEEKNKVKLLEAATSKETEEAEVIELEEVNNSKEEKREPLPAEPPKGFINKLKWLFSN